jgi:hypothetical protein
MQQPFCKPFGNRRLLHCRDPDSDSKGEMPAWVSCGRIIAEEKADFFEFIVRVIALSPSCSHLGTGLQYGIRRDRAASIILAITTNGL